MVYGDADYVLILDSTQQWQDKADNTHDWQDKRCLANTIACWSIVNLSYELHFYTRKNRKKIIHFD